MNVDLAFEIGTIPLNPAKSEFARVLQTEYESLARDLQAEQAAVASSQRDKYGGRLDALLLMVALGNEALTWAVAHLNDSLGEDTEDAAFARYYETLTVLAQRALTTTEEIVNLLTANLVSGARGRLRTLEEIFLVTAILAVHGQPDGAHPDLIERYREHHRVFARSLAEELIASGALPETHNLDATTLTELEQVRSELVGKYGKDYRSLWGWANVLFPQGTKITFSKLSNLVNVDLAAFNSLSSRHVHASSEGWQEAVDTDSSGNLGYVATMASGYLYMTLQAVVPVSSTREDGSVDKRGSEWHEVLHDLALRIRD